MKKYYLLILLYCLFATYNGFAITSYPGAKNPIKKSSQISFINHVPQIPNIAYSISGKLTNEYNVPISGATIYWKQVNGEKGNIIGLNTAIPNDKNFTTTDLLGEFKINTNSPGLFEIVAMTKDLNVISHYVEITDDDPIAYIKMQIDDGGIIINDETRKVRINNKKKKPLQGAPLKKSESIDINLNVEDINDLEKILDDHMQKGLKLIEIEKKENNIITLIFAKTKDYTFAHFILCKEDSMDNIERLLKRNPGYTLAGHINFLNKCLIILVIGK